MFAIATTMCVAATRTSTISRRICLAGAAAVVCAPPAARAAQKLSLVTTPSGLRLADISVGAGDAVEPNSRVTLHVKGRLVGKSGWIFLDTVQEDEPFRLTMGRGTMIDGLEEGLLGMRTGGTRRLVIPSNLGYRDRAHEPVPRSFGQRQRLFGTVLNDNRKQQEAIGLGEGNDVAGVVALDVALLNVRPPLAEEPPAAASMQRLRGGGGCAGGIGGHASRRAATLGLAGAGAMLATGGTTAPPARAYDALPSAALPDPADVARRRREREAKASKKNAEVAPLLVQVSAARDAVAYDAAMTTLTLWIIGTGPPIANDGAAWGSTFDGPLPDGFKTRYLVATCKEALDLLPRFRQKAGQSVASESHEQLPSMVRCAHREIRSRVCALCPDAGT